MGHGYVALWGGLFLVGWGLFWSMFAITVIIPHFNPLHEYRYWELGGVVGGRARRSPSARCSTRRGGLAGQAADGRDAAAADGVHRARLAGRAARAAQPRAAVHLDEHRYWGTDWHYNATVMPILFIAAAEAIGRWRRAPSARVAGGVRRALAPAARASLDLVHSAQAGAARHGGAMMAAIAVALAFQFPLSDLWHGSTYTLDAHVAAADAAMAAVPDGATVTDHARPARPPGGPHGHVLDRNPGNPVTQYIVFDGDDSGYSPPPHERPAVHRELYPKTTTCRSSTTTTSTSSAAPSRARPGGCRDQPASFVRPTYPNKLASPSNHVDSHQNTEFS